MFAVRFVDRKSRKSRVSPPQPHSSPPPAICKTPRVLESALATGSAGLCCRVVWKWSQVLKLALFVALRRAKRRPAEPRCILMADLRNAAHPPCFYSGPPGVPWGSVSNGFAIILLICVWSTRGRIAAGNGRVTAVVKLLFELDLKASVIVSRASPSGCLPALLRNKTKCVKLTVFSFSLSGVVCVLNKLPKNI